MKYFLKRCGFQELGSVGEDGKAKRGRYLMSSLNQEVVDFFPRLSKSIPNDMVLLPIIPLYHPILTYCRYVYHNSKFTGTGSKNPRNEYRIYLNNEIENNQLYFSAEDIAIFRKSKICLPDKQKGVIPVYYVDLVKDHSSKQYFTLSKIIEKYPIRGGYGMFEGCLDFFEKKVANIDDATDNDTQSLSETSNGSGTPDIFNSSNFRDFVMLGYNNTCAISGVSSKDVSNNIIDVVYIRPTSCGGSYKPDNGIALNKELSLAFVTGKISLNDQFEVMVHPECHEISLKKYQYKQIRVPSNYMFAPDKDNLRFHRENIYGKFKRNEED